MSVTSQALVPAREAITVPGANFLLTGQDVCTAYQKTGIYPVALLPGTVHEGAIEWYVRWKDWAGFVFDAAEMPWLPVGHVGPALVLAHCQRTPPPPPLPVEFFQAVLLRQEEYARYLALSAPLIMGAPKPLWDGGALVAPRSMLPERFILPATPRATLEILLEYFPHETLAHQRLLEQQLARRRTTDPLVWPPGYAGAARLLLRHGAVADPKIIRVSDATLKRVPDNIRSYCRAISEYEQNFWYGCEHLPDPTVEDLLLDALGEGWAVHGLLLDGPRTLEQTAHTTAPFAPPSSREEYEMRSRQKVVIEAPKDTSRRQAVEAKPVVEAGEIRISAKEIAALERYDERRHDRDPTKVFKKQLCVAIQSGASDLHIEPGVDRTRVRARIDGRLTELLDMPEELGETFIGVAKTMLGLPSEKFLPQDGNCTIYYGPDAINCRLSTYPIRKCIQKIVIRFLPKRGQVPALDTIMPDRERRILLRAFRSPYGLVLMCGPTGSGKTTTTFSALAAINDIESNITTMENPVEYVLDGVNQAELDEPRGVTWGMLLKGFLRQDPDIGVLGEIRDLATAEIALRQALTGHVVISTLHTVSCAKTVERLIDFGLNTDMLASGLMLVESQRLVRRVCQNCKTMRKPTAEEHKKFVRHFEHFEKLGWKVPGQIWDALPGGCENCRGGHKGRIAAVELLPVTEEVRALIEGKKRARDFADWAYKNGFPTVYESALHLVAQGLITMSEAEEWRETWEDFDFSNAVK
jgi:type IV pilus assembly protein PilB